MLRATPCCRWSPTSPSPSRCLFQGQVLLEIIFAWPGIGRGDGERAEQPGLPDRQACFFLMALTILLLNFIADLLYGLIDPRVTYQ